MNWSLWIKGNLPLFTEKMALLWQIDGTDTSAISATVDTAMTRKLMQYPCIRVFANGPYYPVLVTVNLPSARHSEFGDACTFRYSIAILD